MKNKDYSTIYRIMHWTIAICLLLMLITIFLRMTWMNKNHVANIILDYLPTTNPPLSQKQLVAVAKEIRRPMWDWHIYIGFVLTGLFTIRLFLPLFGEMKFQSPFNKKLPLKEKFEYWSYIVFNICIVISLTTGLLMEFGPKSLEGTMEDIHVLSIYYLLAFIFIHLGGVLIAEFTNQPGLISKIVSGSKTRDKRITP